MLPNVESKGHKLNLDPFITALTVLIRIYRKIDTIQVETKSNLDSVMVVNFFADLPSLRRQRNDIDKRKSLKKGPFKNALYSTLLKISKE